MWLIGETGLSDLKDRRFAEVNHVSGNRPQDSQFSPLSVPTARFQSQICDSSAHGRSAATCGSYSIPVPLF